MNLNRQDGLDTDALREIVDRQQIWDCLLRYARGMDRLDEELALSAYHPGAIEDHGAVIAPCEVFVPQVIAFHRRMERVTQHILTNHSCEIAGDVAHCETYTHCFSVMPEGPSRIGFGRFVDRLERRDGRWGIASRVSVPEGAIEAPALDDRAGMVDLPGTLGKPARDRSDPSYLRPLPLDRAAPAEA
ncbi:nuclear transport factor 2 family protein [Novosphingobium album (ex Liu et al. 2023)]|uniref:Nuclear transport factor 2 family protein n=1 Tax=Novosphingobium album (ex Liu et al. 2023) TaxID=3031130 RepID=A0ABT5WUT6_9SPHN|nr:nuclear transport factor 2 family protein [Novosphingobium album (ex Liu et al. 2023)]MDE8653638.1 nuclear transport factor 2 family protein [Novosphingobium album (ex Liu et al. 2023)]